MSDAAIPPADNFRYDRFTILLHWLTAALVVLLWGVAQVIDLFPRDGGRVEVRSVHILLGVTLLLVVLVRLAWRKTSWGGRQPPRQGVGDLAARGVQVALVLLVLATIALGLLNVAVRGDAIFSWVKVPALSPGYPGLRDSIGELHEWGANLILALAGLHAAAGLAHHFVLHDRVLRRIMPCRNATCARHEHAHARGG
jgi:cytochrome b561